jgi:filamentous hemagglutinin family protein
MNFQKRYYWLLPLYCLLTPTTWAEITFDGTLGAPATLSGPNYNLSTNLGTQVGNNLFHSFGKFNVGMGETAIFESSPNILNIIGRVTGGQTSFINGTIKSPSNLYLLNPYGIAIGKQAKLDINGSLHLGSADYLRFSDNQQFAANTQSPPLLTVAAPESFGFLGNHPLPADITIEGNLKVAPAKDFSVTGGNISISGGDLYAPGGQITLKGLGNVTIENIFWDENAPQGGSVRIQSETFSMRDSKIQLRTEVNPGSIEIVSTGTLHLSGTSELNLLSRQSQAGNILLRGSRIDISENSSVYTATNGTGEGSHIQLEAKDTISLAGTQSKIVAATNGDGRGGNITLQANHLYQQGGFITAESTSHGQAGEVNLNIAGNLSLTHASEISNFSHQEGNAGHIFIQAGNLVMTEGSHIINGITESGSGNGGEVSINVQETAQIEGYPVDYNGKINLTGIASRVEGKKGSGGRLQVSAPLLSLSQLATIQTSTGGEGNAGDIALQVNELHLSGGADIDASNEIGGSGSGGHIEIRAAKAITIAAIPAAPDFIGPSSKVVKEGFLGGIYSTSENDLAIGGSISLWTPKLTLREGGTISAGSVGLGHAGNLTLSVTEALTLDNAAIMTKAERAKGGLIEISNPVNFHLNRSEITTEAKGQQLTDSGGEIKLGSQLFFTLNRSSILARAVGNGGNITITSGNFIQSADSSLDASSQLGVAGKIQIHASAENLNGIVTLPTTFFKAEELFKKGCAEAGISSLVVNYKETLPETPQALGVHIPAKLLKTHEIVPLAPTKIQNAVSEKNTWQTSFVCPFINR